MAGTRGAEGAEAPPAYSFFFLLTQPEIKFCFLKINFTHKIILKIIPFLYVVECGL